MLVSNYADAQATAVAAGRRIAGFGPSLELGRPETAEKLLAVLGEAAR